MTGGLPLSQGRKGVILAVHAQPGARRDEVAGIFAGRLKVRVAAVAEDGRANASLAAFLAQILGLRRADVELVSGPASRRKDFALAGLSLDEARRRLGELLAQAPAPRGGREDA